MRIARTLVAGILQVALAATPAVAGIIVNQFSIREADTIGDQIISYYDARDGFTTFLNVGNVDPSADICNVHVTFYSGGFSVPFQMDLGQVPPGSLHTIDVGSLRDSGLAALPGVAVAYATSIGEGADCDKITPIVTRALSGSFTVANLATGSAWGAAAAARSAIAPTVMKMSSGVESPSGLVPFTIPPVGTAIDGTTVLLQPIQPVAVDLVGYYDPNSLAPVDKSGNQLIFLSFADLPTLPGSPYAATPASTTWSIVAVRNNGQVITSTPFGASGVTVADLASVLGSGVNGASGSIFFEAPSTGDPITRLVFFAEALGTFGTGYRLPSRSVLPGPVPD